ncbi:MAG: serine protease [Bacteroidota bacterium]
MGKQVFKKPPRNLKELQSFLEEEIKEDLEYINLNFESEQSIYESVLKNLKNEQSSTSIYGDKQIWENYVKLQERKSNDSELSRLFYLNTSRLLIAIAQQPSFYVQNNSFVISTNSKWYHLFKNVTKRNIEKAIKAVGRIEHNDIEGKLTWSGTGWLYGDTGYVITNAHVAEKFSQKGHTVGTFLFKEDKNGNKRFPSVDFLEEKNTEQELTFEINEICYRGDVTKGEPDIAVLKLKNPNQNGLPEGLLLEDDNPKNDDNVVIVGYPGYYKDSVSRSTHRNVFCESLFCKIEDFGVKRISPGKIISLDETTKIMKHNCSTSKGNSGSPMINPKTGKVVGIHFAGDYDTHKHNYAYAIQALKTILNNI